MIELGAMLGVLIVIGVIVVKGLSKKRKIRREKPFKDFISACIVGQKEAKEDIARSIYIKAKKQERVGVQRVLGTFMFVGPTGVGKTETAKCIAKWFNERYGHQFLRFDMGNFNDYASASTLTGAPQGYIGSEEGGALTRPLIANNRAVILFDEIEKGHPSLYKTFMSLIDEGEIQDTSTGQRVALNQSIVIFTSNLYQSTVRGIKEKVKDQVKAEMFIRDILTGKIGEVESIVGRNVIEEDIKKLTGTEVSNFPPEFIGRIDKVVVFDQLNREDLAQIVANVMLQNGIVKGQEDVNRIADRIWEIVEKYEGLAKKYGVRMFIKKVEEEIL